MESDIEVMEGDCRELVAKIPEGTIGAVLMDPPYGISYCPGKKSSWTRTTIANDVDTSVRDFMVEWAEARGLPWACFGTWRIPRPVTTRGVLIWDKGSAFGMGDLTFPWKTSWEEISIGGDAWEGPRGEGVLRGHAVLSWESRGRVHPHQKPVSLIGHLLSKLPRDRVVLDPCAGSGSILVACRKAGRRAIGMEIDPKYLPLIRRRLEESQMTLFPIQKEGEGCDT